MKTIKRILLSYLGALILPACLIPIAMICTMGGHSLMFIVVLGSLMGATIAMILLDRRQGNPVIAIIIGSSVGFVCGIFSIAILGSIKVSPFWVNESWILVPAFAPLVVALTSGLCLARKGKQ
jgi:hypothetical protein